LAIRLNGGLERKKENERRKERQDSPWYFFGSEMEEEEPREIRAKASAVLEWSPWKAAGAGFVKLCRT